MCAYVMYRMLKLFGCPHMSCPFSSSPAIENAPNLTANLGGGGLRNEALRMQAISLLSRLMWYDKDQFRRFICILVNTREIPFLLGFLHGYLGFCTEPTNPHSPLPSTASGPFQQQHQHQQLHQTSSSPTPSSASTTTGELS